MSYLINTPNDASFLFDHEIIKNYFGTNEEVAWSFNNIWKDLVSMFKGVIFPRFLKEVNESYMNDLHI